MTAKLKRSGLYARPRYGILIARTCRNKHTEILNIERELTLFQIHGLFVLLSSVPNLRRIRVFRIPRNDILPSATRLSTEEIAALGWNIAYERHNGAFLDTEPLSARERLISIADSQKATRQGTRG